MHSPFQQSDFKLGILGGGQLGKMLCLDAARWDVKTYILDASPDFPAGKVCHKFVVGDFKNFDDVYNFGKEMDVITIEIEHVNTDALKKLQAEGVTVHPSPQSLEIIKDKGLQKQFYAANTIPTAPFRLVENETEIKNLIEKGIINYPFVQKTRAAGYDGKGVAVIKNDDDVAQKLLSGASVIEEKIEIAQEIAIIVARNSSGATACFDAVGMIFNEEGNLVDVTYAPARIFPTRLLPKMKHLATKIIEKLDICGVLAVEFFITKNNDVIVNEVAPRPHNSGHFTIDACHTSQYQQHLRGVLNLPLGDPAMTVRHAVMVNLLGEKGYKGVVCYEGIEECMKMSGVHIHLYGKTTTSPLRKMGHVTITDYFKDKSTAKAEQVAHILKVKSLTPKP
jgi:5-(carboxyamino)imidazole ribonucleotide synthase